MKRSGKEASEASSAGQPALHEYDDNITGTPEQFALLTKLAEFAGSLHWRKCPERRCLRARTCKPRNGECLAIRSDEPMSEEERAELTASFYRMLVEHRNNAMAAERKAGEAK